MKVRFFDKQIISWFYGLLSVISVITSLVFLFVDIDAKYKTVAGIVAVVVFLFIYIVVWIHANVRKSIKLDLNNSTVEVKFGDLFAENDAWKVIAFNEYFDTQVDDVLVAKRTLNGMFINRFFGENVETLDSVIESDTHLKSKVVSENNSRIQGKKTKYQLGSICAVDQYLLTAFTHFDDDNRAFISMNDYIAFLLHFWEEIDRVYAGKTVAIPLFGSGITRFQNYDNISDQELLELILWSFKVSRVRFAYSSEVKIILHCGKRNKINLQALKSIQD